jgi:hypothetical protein
MFEELDVRRVESELVALAGHLAAATCRFLQLLAEFDTRAGWSGTGVRSCSHWLNWRVGLSLRTAREHLRVAHALSGLPAITEAFAGGRISYAKVRAMTRIANPDTERGLLNIALHGTASHVETVVAAARSTKNARPAVERSMQWLRDADGSLLVSLRLPAEDGAQLVAAIEAELADEDRSAEPKNAAPVADGSAEPRQPIAARRADALLTLVAGQQPARPPTIVVHVRADAATTEPDDRPVAWIEGGPAIAPAVAERLACGATMQALVVDRRGNPLHLGRRRRTVSPAQLCALRVRDHDRCVFPGCSQTRRLQAHHVRWWRNGGPTDLDNRPGQPRPALQVPPPSGPRPELPPPARRARQVHRHPAGHHAHPRGRCAHPRLPRRGPHPRDRPPHHHPALRWSGERLDLGYVMACLSARAA